MKTRTKRLILYSLSILITSGSFFLLAVLVTQEAVSGIIGLFACLITAYSCGLITGYIDCSFNPALQSNTQSEEEEKHV